MTGIAEDANLLSDYAAIATLGTKEKSLIRRRECAMNAPAVSRNRGRSAPFLYLMKAEEMVANILREEKEKKKIYRVH
jgi:hypothetical protein